MLNLENIDSPDAWACPLVLTSPRSLAACRLVGVKPVELLSSDIVELADRTRCRDLAELADLRDALELRRMTKLEHCRAIRRYLISQRAIDEHHLLTCREYSLSPAYRGSRCGDAAPAPPVPPPSSRSFQDENREPLGFETPNPPSPPTRRTVPFRQRDVGVKNGYSKKDPFLEASMDRKERYDKRALGSNRAASLPRPDAFLGVAVPPNKETDGCASLYNRNPPNVPLTRSCPGRPVLVDCFGRTSFGPPPGGSTCKGDRGLSKRVTTGTRKSRSSSKSKQSDSSCPSDKLTTSSTDRESRCTTRQSSSRIGTTVASPTSSVGRVLDNANKGRRQSLPDPTETSTIASVTSEREIPEEIETRSDVSSSRRRSSPRGSPKSPPIDKDIGQNISERILELEEISAQSNVESEPTAQPDRVDEPQGPLSDITSKADVSEKSSRSARPRSVTPSDLSATPKLYPACRNRLHSPGVGRLTPLPRRRNSKSSSQGTDLLEETDTLNVAKRRTRRRTRSLSASHNFQQSPNFSAAAQKKCSSEICYRPRSGRCLSEEIRRFPPHSSYFSYRNKIAALGSQWRRTADAVGLSEEDRTILRLLERKALEKKSSEAIAASAHLAWEREKLRRLEQQKWEEERRKAEVSDRREQDHAETVRRLAHLEKNFNRAQRRLAETLRRRDEEAQRRLANIALQRDAMRAQKKAADFARVVSVERQLRQLDQDTKRQRHLQPKETERDWSVDSALGGRPVHRGTSASLLLLPSTPEPCSLRKRPSSAPRLTRATSDPRIVSARMLREALDRNLAASRARYAAKSEAAVRAAATRVEARVQARSQRARITSTKRRVAHLATAAHLRAVRGAAVARLRSRIRAGERKIAAILTAKERSTSKSRATAAVAAELRQRLRGTLTPSTFDRMAAEPQHYLRIPSSRAWAAPADHHSVTHIRLG